MQTRILVADDNAEIREILRILLTGEGYEVIEAKDGNEVLQLFDSSIDLIVLDIMMPNMNGYQTCLKLRETSNVPILFLTAKGLDSDKTLGFSSGADDYLAKPFSYSELTDIEFNILSTLMKNPKQIFSAEQLYEKAWNEPYYYSANNTIMVHIRNLRKKIEKDPANPVYIKTIWGKGYRFE